jgi:hypothetical protein
LVLSRGFGGARMIDFTISIAKDRAKTNMTSIGVQI